MSAPAAEDVDRQLPRGGEIFLDHVGHFVRDIEAASRALAQAGFAPTPVSIQVAPDPDGTQRRTGTGNVTAMLRRGYAEVLFKTAETPLGREFDAAFSRYPGIHLAAFAVADAGAAHRRLDTVGFRTRPLVEMSRPVENAAGPATAAFTIARVMADEMPEGRIQLLTHHTEQAVWQLRWLDHPNGATSLLDIIIAEAGMEEAAQRFSRFTDRPVEANAAGQRIRLDRGGIQIVPADVLPALLPGAEAPILPFIAGYGILVRELDATAVLLRGNGLAVERCGPALIVPFPESLGLGHWVFVERAADLPWRH